MCGCSHSVCWRLVLGRKVSKEIHLKASLVRFAAVILAVIIIVASFAGLYWYFNMTASGRRALVDEASEFNNGLERTINVMTADGTVIRTFTGIIDIEGNDGGYVLFDYNGKRYTYYNCFIESVAEIEE